MEDLMLELNANTTADVLTELDHMESIADVFVDLPENMSTLRQFGHEIASYQNRLKSKMNDIRVKLQYLHERSDESTRRVLADVLMQMSPEIATSRAESSALDRRTGFVNLSSGEMVRRIGIESTVVSPVLCLWEDSVKRYRGNLPRALEAFLTTIEKQPGEFATLCADVASKCEIEQELAVSTLKTLANYDGTLRQCSPENLRMCESAVALASYVLGDQNVYTSPAIVEEIQRRHVEYLKASHFANS